ncbi:MAG: hypothetical protein Unbinned6354contig1000_2 [Prokaryotic dsDNA virus sp.]|nr:hypothetical protein [Cytophagaceae bacterium]QDP54299.1 MAG: hypothetical protein Unbinned6354contig1000_2 [Prokaryotic dsDNA virus sp.]|tara:strand:+ start:2492 stop:2839 length:348 start_codon:yes stop_codon:yes gene_type:complete
MATVIGQLGAVAVAGTGTLTDIYTVPTDKKADVNITIANRADTDTNIRVAHIKAALAASVADEDYITYDLPTSTLADNRAPMSYTAILMTAGDTIAVYSSASAVSVQVNGIEEDV